MSDDDSSGGSTTDESFASYDWSSYPLLCSLMYSLEEDEPLLDFKKKWNTGDSIHDYLIKAQPDEILFCLLTCIHDNQIQLYQFIYSNLDDNIINCILYDNVSLSEQFITNILDGKNSITHLLDVISQIRDKCLTHCLLDRILYHNVNFDETTTKCISKPTNKPVIDESEQDKSEIKSDLLNSSKQDENDFGKRLQIAFHDMVCYAKCETLYLYVYILSL